MSGLEAMEREREMEETALRNGISGAGDCADPIWKPSTVRGHLDFGS